MTTQHQLDHPGEIEGYDYGGPGAPASPLTIEELRKLEAAAGLGPEEDRHLAMAADVLRDQAAGMVDAWRAQLGEHAHLAIYGAHPDGTPNPEYAAASHPRFARWVIDSCTRPRDQEWLEYQHAIGLRHTPAAKNATDHADAPPFIPMRYLLAFTGPVIASGRSFLAAKGHSSADVDAMHAAWTKSVLLHVTVWRRAYEPPEW